MNHTEDLKSLYAAFARGEVPAVLEAMSSTIEWREAEGNPYSPKGEPFTGPHEVLNKLFMRLTEEWEGFTVTPATYHDAGKTVIVEGRYTGTFKATGKDADAQFCHIWKFDDNKISHFQQYTNTAAMQEIMGITTSV